MLLEPYVPVKFNKRHIIPKVRRRVRWMHLLPFYAVLFMRQPFVLIPDVPFAQADFQVVVSSATIIKKPPDLLIIN